MDNEQKQNIILEKTDKLARKDKRLVIILCSLFFVFCSLFFIWRGIYYPIEPNSEKEVIMSIQKGEGSKEIAINLRKESLIKSAFLFRFYTLLTGISKKLQAGEYLLSPSMTIPEIAQKIVAGDVIKEKITIVEGWNLKNIGQYFEDLGLFSAEEFLEVTKEDFSEEFDFLKDKPKNLNLEGYLFPDTYYIQLVFSTIVENTSSKRLEEIVKRMLENFDKKLTPELREEISRQGKTIFEIVIMASMIEKEVKTSEDKKIVSGILWKRLENNIPLQVDATILYILNEKATNPEGVAPRPYGAGISLEETKIDSPYNTYKYRGLPFGPISNPGLESILAAIYPEESPFWYYLSTPEGETIFSRTLEEHNIARAKYLR